MARLSSVVQQWRTKIQLKCMNDGKSDADRDVLLKPHLMKLKPIWLGWVRRAVLHVAAMMASKDGFEHSLNLDLR